MFERAHRAELPRRLFLARMAGFAVVALILDGVILGLGTIGFHWLEELDWLDAAVNVSLS